MRQTSQTFTMDGGERTVAMSNFHYFPSWTHRPEWNSVHIRHRKVFRRFRAPGSLWFSFLLCFLTLWSVSEGAVKTSSSSQQARCYVDDPQTGLIPDLSQIDAFTQQPNVYSIRACAKRCCRTPSCDLAFLGNGLCFLVDCSYSETVCQPQEGNEETYIALVTRNSTFGPLADTSSSSQHRNSRHKGSSTFYDYPLLHDSFPLNPSDTIYGDDTTTGVLSSSPDTNPELLREEWVTCYSRTDCGLNEECFKLPGDGSFDEGICICQEQFTYSTLGHTCMPQSATYTDSVKEKDDGSNGETTMQPKHESPDQKGQTTVKVPKKESQDETPENPEVEEKNGGATAVPTVAPTEVRPVDTTTTRVVSKTTASSVPGTVTTTVEPVGDNGANVNQSGNSSSSLITPSLHVTSVYPPTTASSTTAKFVTLHVSGGDSKVLQLPQEDHITLHTFVVPEDEGEYKYDWRLVSGPEESTANIIRNGEEMKVTDLQAGLYTFEINVTSPNGAGSARVNITVLSPPRENTPPVAVVYPKGNVEVYEDEERFLDATKSTDDTDGLTFLWEVVTSPVDEDLITGHESLLKLQHLSPGFYQFRLTVTDIDGATDVALVNVTVKEEVDLKPFADPGEEQVIHLPTDEVILNGNGSRDDHGIVKWEWTIVEGGLADMSGSSDVVLKASKLQQGIYTFRLKVYDSKGQSANNTVRVHVLSEEENKPPVADAGPHKELSLPDDSTTLDGSGSRDDVAIATYLWEMIKGPDSDSLVIENADTATVTVSGLVAGDYTFKLTVTDGQGESNSATTQVLVKKEVNMDPVANAGRDITISLPTEYVELDGSLSSDDKGIVSYSWTKDEKSPAAGVILDNTQSSARLKIGRLVVGVYVFNLTVADAKGRTSSDTATVRVKEDPHANDLVELLFDKDVSAFKESEKKGLVSFLESVVEGEVILQEISHTSSGRLLVIFYATNSSDGGKPIGGPTVLKMLKDSSYKMQPISYDTVVCQKNCSNHGTCNKYSRKCVCETFWMENFFRVQLGDGESNCDWSILYVIIIAFFSTMLAGLLIWLLTCCFNRKRKKSKRKHQYSLLTDDLEGHDAMELLPKANGNVLDKLTDIDPSQGKQNSSIMVSASGEDTDDEITVYEHRKRRTRSEKKPLNGHVKRSKRYPGRNERL
ncbi:dyslexia-associated protein KIAA0319-like protein isoform X3 [Apostichopus japonicus]|uniref:dyslexia-associated protein KIAA0319-like protein isoform X3 n=1 Tax=Stichopus japonicus TaxID=307972 RepID=UPI003AB2D56A